MYNLAKTIDSSVTREQSSYFPVASLNRLGTSQAAQFQSGNQYGQNWYWTSRYNESGQIITSQSNCSQNRSCWENSPDVWVENNFHAEMPRSYHNGNNAYGDYYNWYAATAESGVWSMNPETPSTDSICPKGWKLPIDGDSTTAKSFAGLLFGSYGLTSDSASSAEIRKSSISMVISGCFDTAYGTLACDLNGYLWSSSSGSGVDSSHRLLFSRSIVNPSATSNKTAGFSMRCVKQ